MKKAFKKFLLTLIGIACLFASCKKDKQIINDNNETTNPFETGVFIVNEGAFQTGTGTVSFLNRSTKVVKQDVFNLVNNRPLGNVAQSMTIFNDKAYIVVNNAAKVEVVDAKTFKSVGVINDVSLPRFFIGVSSIKGYVSSWSGKISVINLSDNSITKTINVGGSPDKMIATGGKAYIIGSAGFTSDSTFHIIDIASDTKLNTLVIGDNPSDMVLDANNKIWIICGAIPHWVDSNNTKNAVLVKFNPTTNSVEQTFDLGSKNFGAKIVINAAKTKLFYTLSNGIYAMDVNNPVVSQMPFIAKSFYAIGFDNTESILYGADPKLYTGNGWVYRYNATSASVVDSFQVGIIPTFFSFN